MDPITQELTSLILKTDVTRRPDLAEAGRRASPTTSHPLWQEAGKKPSEGQPLSLPHAKARGTFLALM